MREKSAATPEDSAHCPQTGNIFYGWLDDPAQTEPTYEPPRDAPCPFCGFPVHGEEVSTHSLMYKGQYAARSYFYRSTEPALTPTAPEQGWTVSYSI